MQVTLSPEQEKFVRTYLLRHDGLSVEDVIDQALLVLEAKDGFDLAPYLAPEEIEAVRQSILETQAEPYFTAEDIGHWVGSLGQSFHERVDGPFIAQGYRVSQHARRDLADLHAQWLALDAGQARLIISEMLEIFTSLSVLPNIGRPWVSQPPLRVFAHRHTLIFYGFDEAADDDIKIERIVAIAQDPGKGQMQ